MTPWRHVKRGLRVLLNRHAADAELDAEIRHYFEEAESAAVASGMTQEEARRAARLEFGGVTAVREEVRSSAWEHAVDTLCGDVRYAVRRLVANPGFAAVSALTLAVGIGATTAILTAVDEVLLRPLPYANAERIVTIADRTNDGEPLDVTFGTYLELADRSHSFDALAPFKPWQPTIIGGSEPERLSGERVGSDFFQAFGVRPFLGRTFLKEEDRPGGGDVVVLSYAVWRRRFGADPSIVGRFITLDDRTCLVAGVLPADFNNVLAPSTEVWAPLQYSRVFDGDSREWGHNLRLVGRVRPDVAIAAARQDVDRIAAFRDPGFPRVPWATLDAGLITTQLQSDATRAVRPALLAVLGGVILLLLIACVNVTNLLLARGSRRTGEFALRLALGAGRTRVFRQLLIETLVIAGIGGAFAVGVAVFGIRMLAGFAPAEFAALHSIHPDKTIFLVAFVLTTTIAVLVSVIPGLYAARQNLHERTHNVSRSIVGTRARTRTLLVAAEVAVALMLLASAGLLFRTISRVFAAPAGFDSTRLLTMQVQISGRQYASATERLRFYSEAAAAAQSVPGVSGAAFTALLPLGGELDVYGVHFEADVDANRDVGAVRYAVTPDYFDVMRIPLRAGRVLDAHDNAAGARAVLINEAFAHRRFAGRSPIGHRLRFGQAEGDWYTIVGVVGDVRQSALDLAAPDAVYVPTAQWHWVDTVMTLVVRSDTGAPLTPVVRHAIWSVDKDIPIVRIATMDALVERAIADRRFALILFEAFGFAALILVSVGIYGVLAGSVAERTHEIGVRSALGAAPRAIVALVVRDGLAAIGGGAVAGILGMAAATRLLTALLFEISPLDPVTYVGVVGLLLGACVIACWAPARRAASIDPSIALRGE